MTMDQVQDGPHGGDSGHAEATRPGQGGGTAGARLPVALALLVALADLLFFGRAPGLSLAVFAAALLLAVRLACGPRRLTRGDLGTASLLVLAVLPVVELAQALSLLILGTGLVVTAMRVTLGEGASARAVRQGALRFVARYPWLAAKGARGGLSGLARSRPGRIPAGHLAQAWLLPGAAGLVLVALLLAANPVLSLWAERLGNLPPRPGPFLRHLAFWAVAALLLWPFLALARERGGLAEPWAELRPLPGRPAWVNDISVRNSLVLFNLLLGVQTLLDLGYLWGGMELPEGVTHAQYARQGAYPLMATALLAGAFALVSWPFAEGRPALRALLGLWIAQNLLLVVSALLRLDLNVEAFGLTRLRLAAVWMALVVGGLVLTAWQAWRGPSNGWLLGRVAVMALGVLYLCCFVKAADVIARTNLDRWERTGRLDRAYLCSLGPGAGPAIAAQEAQAGRVLCGPVERLSLRAPPPRDWRERGFRNWRLRRYADGAEAGREDDA